MRRLTTVIILLLVFSGSAFSQLTTEGTDFWFGFMQNVQFDQRPVTIEVYISSRQQAEIRLRNVSGSFDESRTIGANTSITINVPLDLMAIAEGKTDFGLNLTSDVDVSVYALNKAIFTADATVILPSKSLGKEYFVMAHKEPVGDGTGNDLNSQMLVVATEDGTEVEITPSVPTVRGLPAGQPHTIQLNQGETYQIQSRQDLTGTKVQVVENGNSCGNIAVFGGNIFTNVGGCGGNHDHLYEQMFPVKTWGREYLWLTYETRTGGDYLKATAAEDGTVLSITGRPDVVLNAGETQVIKALTGPRLISASNPIQVAQLSRSSNCDFQTNSDPFMIMLSPLEQRISQATFDAFEVVGINQYYVTLITEDGTFDEVTLDGVDISGQFQTAVGKAYASLTINRGTHTLIAPEGVIAYVYGYGPNESFGYAAGVSLESLNVQVTAEDPYVQADIISKEGCINAPIAFSAQFEVVPGQQPRYDTFDWDFGDGSTGTGKDTVHIYTQPGEYEITLIASNGNSACGGDSDVIRGTVTIVDVEVDPDGILGAVSVCPDVSGVEYSLEGPADNTYVWEVGGGLITSANNTDRITVDWGMANDNAFVRVIPKNRLGCPGDTLTLPVKINKRLEPLLPRGDAELCVTDIGNVIYSTPLTNGSEYEWLIEGGTIQGGGNSNEVTVSWDGVGTGKIWYREFNPNISDCEGFSPQLAVTIYDEITATETITDVLCNGGSSGSISLALAGGKQSAGYTVTWNNGMSGTEISGLAAGVYEATIRDAVGCALIISYTVDEPRPLVITSSSVQNVRCFQESNGMITIEAEGGTPGAGYTYTVRGNGVNSTSTDATITGLATGDYQVTVRDANGCETEMDLFVDQPPLLEPDLETLINLPICPDATDGTAYIEAKGGTPDYQFFWSNDPTVDEQEGMNFSQGTYTVRIVDANGCETTLDIEVTERFPKIYLPNAFSPNGDGENDEFKPVTDCSLSYSLQIFNEWGAITFATNDVTEGWDGTLEGVPAPNGKYSYIVFYSGSLNGVSFEETLRGTLRLLR